MSESAISEIYRAMQGKMTLKEFFLGLEGTWRPQPLTDAIRADIESMKRAAEFAKFFIQTS